MQKTLTTQEVAELLGYNPAYVRRAFLASGKLPSRRLNKGKYIVLQSDLEAFLRNRAPDEPRLVEIAPRKKRGGAA